MTGNAGAAFDAPDEPAACDLCSLPDALVGVCIHGVYDGVLFWRCQACGRAQERQGGPLNKRARDVASTYVWQINRAVVDAQRYGRTMQASDSGQAGEPRV